MAGTVLVVDDDVNLHSLIEALLQRDGFDVDFATDGEHGLQKLQTRDYDAVLVGLFFPPETGIGLLRSIAEIKPRMLEKVVVVSTAPRRILDHAQDLRVHAIVRKPFDIYELLETVRSCVRPVCES